MYMHVLFRLFLMYNCSVQLATVDYDFSVTIHQESSAHGWDLIGTSDPKVFKHSPIPVYSCMEFPLMKPSVLIIGQLII